MSLFLTAGRLVPPAVWKLSVFACHLWDCGAHGHRKEAKEVEVEWPPFVGLHCTRHLHDVWEEFR